MESFEKTEEKKSGTIFGIPIIKTKCQRDSFLYGITSGITGGLIAFLFTSNTRRSTHIGMGCYALITFSCACYCTFQDYKMMKQARIIQKAIYEATNSNYDQKLNVLDYTTFESA